jgi:hypothetical protein
MGTVYEAQEDATGRRVALKLLAPEYAESADAVARFRREGQLASALTHPRCVFVLAADQDAGRPYIVMELMPGDTLEDLVRRDGPLTPAEAVAKILDVIEGLREAHKLGIVHRDVKPSNCFVEAGGRVKVGDFGLAKALARDAGLTKTGSFLGTPLFAAPEQIKGEVVDQQADVYAVAATLYYLLAGRAPFQGDDAAAVLARILSEPAPSLRGLRPELDAGLDRVVLRGLERDRSRRWGDLAEFRAALLRCQPDPLSPGGMGPRFVAFLLDWCVVFVATAGVDLALTLAIDSGSTDAEAAGRLGPRDFLDIPLFLLYFTLLEGLWGASPGKRLLQLRVCTPRGSTAPGLARAFARNLILDVLLSLGPLLGLAAWQASGPPDPGSFDLSRDVPAVYLALAWFLGGVIVGVGLLLAPMRRRNGYRGPHEFLSGTRVVSLPGPERRRPPWGRPSDRPVLRPEAIPERLGPFVVRGALCWGSHTKVLAGQDSALGREVWVWLRPPSDPPLSRARQQLARATRLRWLAGGQEADSQWDAFVAPAGCPLPELVRTEGGLPWSDVRPLLGQLADELAEACGEGMVPDPLRPDQVWLRPDGTLQLLDMPFGDGPSPEDAPAPGEARDVGAEARRRALALLGQVAVLSLEGRLRAGNAGGRICAPVPGHAARLLERLAGRGQPYGGVQDVQADLRVIRDRPTEVGRRRRLAHLVMLAALVFVGLVCCMFPAGWVRGLIEPVILTVNIHEGEESLRALERGALLDASVGAVNPDPFARLRAVAQLQQDYRVRDLLGQELERARRLRTARVELLNWVSRWLLLQIDKVLTDEAHPFEQTESGADPEGSGSLDFRSKAMDASLFLVIGQYPIEQYGGRTWMSFSFWLRGLLLGWPACWVAWAFLFRGGLSYRLTGIALVRADGRPASRLQCAWRALLVWAPVTALLVQSCWLDNHYWSTWRPDTPNRWMLAAANACWYAAVGLLLAYAGLALWRPTRSLHDRLAGTFLVPR